MRNHSTISFLDFWEQIHNPNFKPIEFDMFKAESGDNVFALTPQQKQRMQSVSYQNRDDMAELMLMRI